MINMKNNFKNWFKCAGIRAIKTVAQTAVATIGTSVAIGDVNWIKSQFAFKGGEKHESISNFIFTLWIRFTYHYFNSGLE